MLKLVEKGDAKGEVKGDVKTDAKGKGDAKGKIGIDYKIGGKEKKANHPVLLLLQNLEMKKERVKILKEK